jgi:hypothetical protein
LAIAWDGGTQPDAALAPVAHRTAAPYTSQLPIAGDEGFWLSRQDLPGATATALAVGDHIRIAPKGTVTEHGERDFKIVELRPLAEAAQLSVARAGEAGLGAPQLLLVVCREVQTPSAVSAPQMLRFLVEQSAASTLAHSPRSL